MCARNTETESDRPEMMSGQRRPSDLHDDALTILVRRAGGVVLGGGVGELVDRGTTADCLVSLVPSSERFHGLIPFL